MLALALLVAAPQFASDLQPATYTSPFGEWELFVNPSDRTGAGTAEYRVTRRGDEVWSAELPFTLRSAVIDDAGVAAGFAWTEGDTGYAAEGEFLVAVLSDSGEIVFEERTKRTPGPEIHSYPEPSVRGLLLQPVLGQLVLRTDGKWWRYDLREPEAVDRIVPWNLDEVERITWSMSAHAVPGTPLIISQWYERHSARFVLLDEDLEEAWTLVLEEDYAKVDGDDPLYEIRDSGGAILATEDHRFDLRFFVENARVTFEIERDPEAERGWTVAEVAREPYEPADTVLDLPEIEDIELQLITTVELQASAGEPVVRDVIEFAVEPDGTVRFLRNEGGGVTSVRLDSSGKLLDEVELDPTPLAGDGFTHWAAMPGTDWVLGHAPYEDTEARAIWIFDGRTGQARRVVDLEHEWISQMEAFPGGVLLGDWRGESYRWHTLTCYDLQGGVLWEINTEEKSQQFPMDGLAAHEDGRCAVLGSISDEIHLIDAGGHVETVLDIEEFFPGMMRLPESIQPDENGGWLVYGAALGESDEYSLLRLHPEGTELGSLTPHYEDGREEPRLAWWVHRAGDGKLWTSDRTALYQLDDEGLIVRTVGSPPSEEALTNPREFQIDRHGRLLAKDWRTHVLHVFDSTGARIALLRPPEGEEQRFNTGRYVSVHDDGRFLVPTAGSFLEFAADGSPQGEVELPVSHPRYQPGLGTAWGFLDGWLARIDIQGAVLTRIERFPDGHWLGNLDIAVSPEGNLAVTGWVRGEDFLRLDVYDPMGELLHSLRLPYEARGDPIIHGDLVVLEYFGPAVHLVSLESGTLHRFTLDQEGEEKTSWTYGISPEGQELWAVSPKTLKLYRFELP